jgi:hypothetical protein
MLKSLDIPARSQAGFRPVRARSVCKTVATVSTEPELLDNTLFSSIYVKGSMSFHTHKADEGPI